MGGSQGGMRAITAAVVVSLAVACSAVDVQYDVNEGSVQPLEEIQYGGANSARRAMEKLKKDVQASSTPGQVQAQMTKAISKSMAKKASGVEHRVMRQEWKKLNKKSARRLSHVKKARRKLTKLNKVSKAPKINKVNKVPKKVLKKLAAAKKVPKKVMKKLSIAKKIAK